MTVVVSLLRGVNVGGHHKMGMDELRAVYESLGLLDVRTCGQSGNVVFRTAGRNTGALAQRIETAIEQRFGFAPTVILRTSADLQKAISGSPFANRPGIHPSKLVVMFLDAEPDAEARDRLLSLDVAPEEFRLDGRDLHVYFPNGVGRPKLPAALVEKTLRVAATARNWNTVTKLLELASESTDVDRIRKPRSARSRPGSRLL